MNSSSFPPILALDFTGIGAAQSFKTVLSETPRDTVRRVDPVKGHFDAHPSVDEQAAQICRTHPQPPAFLLGYCTAALLAVTVAGHYRRSSGSEPHVVLFDPDPISPDYLHSEFALLIGKLGGEPGAAPDEQSGIRFYEAALADRRPALLEEHGGDAEMVDYILTRHRAWLRFLASGAAGGPADIDGPVSVIMGRRDLDLTPILRHPQRHRLYQTDAPEGGLLDHPSTRQMLEAVIHR